MHWFEIYFSYVKIILINLVFRKQIYESNWNFTFAYFPSHTHTLTHWHGIVAQYHVGTPLAYWCSNLTLISQVARRDVESCHINGYSQLPDICRCMILHVNRPLQHIPINASWGPCQVNVLTIVGNLQNTSQVCSWQFGLQCCWNNPSLDYVESMSVNGHKVVHWSIVCLGGPLVPAMLAHLSLYGSLTATWLHGFIVCITP